MCALIVGSASAFDTTDHDCMLWIMYDLGFPTDAADTVKNGYDHVFEEFMKTPPTLSGSPQ
eukprot:1157755-Pelagomonas_calceolata.AAC.10